LTHSRITLALASARLRTLAFKQVFAATPRIPEVSHDEQGLVQGTPTPTTGVVVGPAAVVVVAATVVVTPASVVVTPASVVVRLTVRPIPVLLLGAEMRVTQVPAWQP
jgi:hypothetical protein